MLNSPLEPHTHFAVIDVETTGFDAHLDDEIVEIAAQRIVRGKVVGTYQSLVRSVKPVPVSAQLIHGISQELLDMEGRNISDVLDEFLEFVKGAVLVGHNVQFDLGFLNAHLARLQRTPLSVDTFDTCVMARRQLLLPRYTLAHVARYLKVPQTVAHRALADVETTREVFLKLMDREQQGAKKQVRQSPRT